MIKYTNISNEEYKKLSKKEKAYCIEYVNNGKDWIVNDKLHREDGPAVEYVKPIKNFWYLNDIRYSFEKWLELTPISDEEKIFLRIKYS